MRLRRNRAFAVFWVARTIPFAGTGITMVVLPVLVYGMTHSPAAFHLLVTGSGS